MSSLHKESLNFRCIKCLFIPFQYKDANIQLLDLPGIIEGAAHGECYDLSYPPLEIADCTGKGRGRQVIAVARTADLVLMMLDAGKGEIQKLASLNKPCQLLL